ncbi:MAG: CBS domain-containing protein [Bacilli bacterium]
MTKIREIMAKDVRTCSLKDNVFEVAVMMKEENVGAIPIVDGRRLVGIITDRDIVIRGVAEKNPGSSSVEQIMSTDLVVGNPDMSVEDATELMSTKEIRRLPIVENDELIGIVALGDIAARTQFVPIAAEALQEISESHKTLN